MPDEEWAVQRRIYVDQGFEESRVETSLYHRPHTEESARLEASRQYLNPDDTTGLPPARAVRREVGEWEPA